MLASCNLDIPNPNAAPEADVLTTKDGLIALAKGIEQNYATVTLGAAILTPAVSGREVAATTTFSSLEELENGGAQLSGENERVSRLFASTMRTKGMAESLQDNIDNVSLLPGTKSGLEAIAALYRGMCIGVIAYNWEQVPLKNSKKNDAVFVDRMTALREAIADMEAALSGLATTPPSSEFKSFLNNIDLKNTLSMYVARFALIVGDYDKAIAMADSVDMSAAPKFFFYDSQNKNPVFSPMFEGTVQYGPRKDFGLPTSLAPDAGDQRVAFYLGNVTKPGINYDVDSLVAPFFTAASAGIPIIYPSEANLIKAEAYANKNDFTNAEKFLNLVRNKDAASDVLGIGAGLGDTFSAGGDKPTLMNEIYKNRRIELYLTGMGLEDSRRLGRPTPPDAVDYTSERNRNFYPYPEDERLNNPNTPANPSI